MSDIYAGKQVTTIGAWVEQNSFNKRYRVCYTDISGTERTILHKYCATTRSQPPKEFRFLWQARRAADKKQVQLLEDASRSIKAKLPKKDENKTWTKV